MTEDSLSDYRTYCIQKYGRLMCHLCHVHAGTRQDPIHGPIALCISHWAWRKRMLKETARRAAAVQAAGGLTGVDPTTLERLKAWA